MKFRKLKHFLRVAAPTICSCLAALGVIATGVLSAKAALKAEGTINDDNLSVKDKVKKAAPVFAPPVVAGGATIGLIFTANAFGRGQQAALAAGMASVYKSLQTKLAPQEIQISGEADTKQTMAFYDPFSMRYFERTIDEVLEAEYHLNRNFILRGDASMNEFYRFLGLEETPDGDEYGWSQCVGFDVYGYQWIDFCHDFVQKGETIWDNTTAECDCYVIDTPFDSTDDYLTYPYEE